MKKWIIISILLVALIVGGLAAFGYLKIMKPVVPEKTDLFIKTGTNMAQLRQQLIDEKVVSDISAFDVAAKLLRYENRVFPGKYILEKNWTAFKLVRKLRSGDANPVRVTFHNVRRLEDVAGKVAPYIEADSLELLNAMKNSELWKKYGVTDAVFCHIIPNTYEFFWNTSGDEFVERMAKESAKFWNDERSAKAAEIGLTPCQVVNLAAIVQEEQSAILSEQPRIAGLYINRLNQKMLLQADPTLKFAAGDFSIKRVLNYHKQIESPYNTYKYLGLPPGPIVIPEISAIEAVLKYEKHDYIYMCAKEDFSGYHNFSKTLSQHTINALKWQRALSREMRAGN
ncbi:endolytic transglycosylase MltG [bacterium]|nr:endolytic transglycosylase MltG [bacterium]